MDMNAARIPPPWSLSARLSFGSKAGNAGLFEPEAHHALDLTVPRVVDVPEPVFARARLDARLELLLPTRVRRSRDLEEVRLELPESSWVRVRVRGAAPLECEEEVGEVP